MRQSSDLARLNTCLSRGKRAAGRSGLTRCHRMSGPAFENELYAAQASQAGGVRSTAHVISRAEKAPGGLVCRVAPEPFAAARRSRTAALSARAPVCGGYVVMKARHPTSKRRRRWGVMATYVLLVKLTDKGAADIENMPARIDQSIKAWKEVGGKDLTVHLTMGEYGLLLHRRGARRRDRSEVPLRVRQARQRAHLDDEGLLQGAGRAVAGGRRQEGP